MPHDAVDIRRRMAVCSWSLQPESPADLLDALQQTGIRAVSLALSPMIHQPDIFSSTIDVLTDAGIDLRSGMMATLGEDYTTLKTIAATGGIRPDGTWKANLAHAHAVAELAAAAGLALVTFHAGFLPEDPGGAERAVILDRIGQIADIFAARNIALGLETGQESAETLEAALAEIDRPNLGVNFDPANMILYGMGDPIAALKRLLPHVRQVHVKDARCSESVGQWGTEVPVGCGEVNWPEFFSTIRHAPRSIDFVIEREAGKQRVADVRAAAELIMQLA